MRAIAVVAVCVLQLTLVRALWAQAIPNLAVTVRANTIGVTGGEQGNTSSSSGATTSIGKAVSSAFAKLPHACGFAVARTLVPGGVGGWTVDVTPLRFEDSKVTMRIQWARLANEAGIPPTAGTMEISLQAGESIPLDIVPITPKLTMPYDQCGVRATSLRVGVERWPRVDNDRRLVGLELWLVERRADGTEHAQPVTLRGLFGQPIPFYFDTIAGEGMDVDFYGDFTATQQNGALAVDLAVRARIPAEGQLSNSVAMANGLYGARQVESSMTLQPGEVVAIQLPRLTETTSGGFAGRTYSLRLRAVQIR